MADPMRVVLQRREGALFEATNEKGHRCLLEGPPVVGGTDSALRPMEMVLVGLAGCSAVDVLLILQKGRHEIADLRVEVEGERAEAVPAVFTRIHLRFIAAGDFSREKLQRAADLSIEKYCSVAKMLMSTVQIDHSVVLGPEA